VSVKEKVDQEDTRWIMFITDFSMICPPSIIFLVLSVSTAYPYVPNPLEAQIIMVKNGDANSGAPEYVGTIYLPSPVGNLFSAAVDPQGNYAYFSTNAAPSSVTRLRLGTHGELPTQLETLTFPQGQKQDLTYVGLMDLLTNTTYWG